MVVDTGMVVDTETGVDFEEDSGEDTEDEGAKAMTGVSTKV